MSYAVGIRVFLLVGVVLMIFSAPLSIASAQQVPTTSTPPPSKLDISKDAAIETAMKKLAVKFAADFNRNDAKAVAAHWLLFEMIGNVERLNLIKGK